MLVGMVSLDKSFCLQLFLILPQRSRTGLTSFRHLFSTSFLFRPVLSLHRSFSATHLHHRFSTPALTFRHHRFSAPFLSLLVEAVFICCCFQRRLFTTPVPPSPLLLPPFQAVFSQPYFYSRPSDFGQAQPYTHRRWKVPE